MTPYVAIFRFVVELNSASRDLGWVLVQPPCPY